MGSTVIVAEKTATVLRMVEIALAGLDLDIQGVDHGEAALQALRDAPAQILIARDRLPDMSGYDVVEALRADDTLKHLPVILLLDRNEAPDQDRVDTLGMVDGMNLPFKTQTLVERVCGALGREVPDAALYAPYSLEIPLANAVAPQVTPHPEDAESSPSEEPFPEAMPSAEPDPVVVSTTPESMEQSPATSAENFDPDRTADNYEPKHTPPELIPPSVDAETSTQVFTAQQPQFEERELEESGLLSIVEYGSSAYLQTEDDLESVNQDEVITNAIRPAPPVAPMPDLDELVEQVRNSITEGAGFRGALGEVSRSVIEEVAWEVVPALAEAILKEEIARMIREGQTPN